MLDVYREGDWTDVTKFVPLLYSGARRWTLVVDRA